MDNLINKTPIAVPIKAEEIIEQKSIASMLEDTGLRDIEEEFDEEYERHKIHNEVKDMKII